MGRIVTLYLPCIPRVMARWFISCLEYWAECSWSCAWELEGVQFSLGIVTSSIYRSFLLFGFSLRLKICLREQREASFCVDEDSAEKFSSFGGCLGAVCGFSLKLKICFREALPGWFCLYKSSRNTSSRSLEFRLPQVEQNLYLGSLLSGWAVSLKCYAKGRGNANCKIFWF